MVMVNGFPPFRYVKMLRDVVGVLCASETLCMNYELRDDGKAIQPAQVIKLRKIVIISMEIV